MNQETAEAPAEQEEKEKQPEEVTEEAQQESKTLYDLHIKVQAEMRQTLRDCAELAYKMGDITKPDLVDLMNLYIGWGIEIQKKKWLDRIGYR